MGRRLHHWWCAASILFASCLTSSCAGTPLLAVAGEKAAIRIIHVGRMKSVACLQVCSFAFTNTIPITTAPWLRRRVSQGHGRSINDLRFLPSDPNMLLSCSSDESCRLWNVVTLQLAVIFGGWHGHRSAVLSLDVHLLGRMFASCGMDNR
jgi:WD40 repeat protein